MVKNTIIASENLQLSYFHVLTLLRRLSIHINLLKYLLELRCYVNSQFTIFRIYFIHGYTYQNSFQLMFRERKYKHFSIYLLVYIAKN